MPKFPDLNVVSSMKLVGPADASVYVLDVVCADLHDGALFGAQDCASITAGKVVGGVILVALFLGFFCSQ